MRSSVREDHVTECHVPGGGEKLDMQQRVSNAMSCTKVTEV